MPRALDRLISKEDQERVLRAVQAAERRTSGEIRVHLEARCPGGDPYRRAVRLFEKLGMTATRERNGVLVYVAVRDREIAILGDRGVHEHVGQGFWDEALDRMREHFRRGDQGGGLVTAVEAVGDRLAERFPRRADDRNELPDEISTS